MSLEPRIRMGLLSNDPELKNLMMEVVKDQYPLLWAALQGYTYNTLTNDVMTHLEKSDFVSIGWLAKYKGLENIPLMVVTQVNIRDANRLSAAGAIMATFLTCKYYNKSTQNFVEITDRVECFEFLNKKHELQQVPT